MLNYLNEDSHKYAAAFENPLWGWGVSTGDHQPYFTIGVSMPECQSVPIQWKPKEVDVLKGRIYPGLTAIGGMIYAIWAVVTFWAWWSGMERFTETLSWSMQTFRMTNLGNSLLWRPREILFPILWVIMFTYWRMIPSVYLVFDDIR